MADDDELDPRIAVVSTYRPPPPRRKRASPIWRWLLIALGLVCTPPAAILAAEVYLATDSQLPRVDHLDDYQPPRLTQLVTSTGEPLAEVGGARRIMLAAKDDKPLAAALVAHVEPTFLTRPSIGQNEMLHALADFVRGRKAPEPLSVKLASSFVRERFHDTGIVHLMRSWLAAIRLEFRLTRAELVHLYLDQISFGGGGYGIEIGSLGRFGKPVSQLDDKQLTELVALDTDVPGPVPPKPRTPNDACGAVAVERLSIHYPPEALSHLGARVVTTCDPDLTATAADAIRRRHLEKLGLNGSAVVMRLPSHEVVAIVAGADEKHPIGVLRSPFVIASALESLKWTAASQIGQSGMTLTLRDATARSPAATADALIAAGLPTSPVFDLAIRSGLPPSATLDSFIEGRAPITLVDAAQLLATLATEGERREQLLLRSVQKPGGASETPTETARLQAMSPEAAFLIGSLLSKPVRTPLGRPSAGMTGTEGVDTWLGVYTPDLVVAVWLGPAHGNQPSRGGEVERTAIAIGIDIVAQALKGKKPTPFKQPEKLFVRRLDARGQIIARGVPGGTPELFIPGSQRREEMELAPEPDLDKKPPTPAP